LGVEEVGGRDGTHGLGESLAHLAVVG